jgi:hypothetical protein
VDSGNVAVRALEIDKMVNGSRDGTDYFVRAGASDRQAGLTKKRNSYGK